jgi:hypothetical protein
MLNPKNKNNMKVKLTRSYKSKNGNTVFVYTAAGTDSQVEAYKAAQGDNYRESEDGTSLWFTTRCIGNTGTLVITEKGKVVPDMSAFEQAASLAKQYGGNFGQELARASVASLLGNSAPVADASGLDSFK